MNSEPIARRSRFGAALLIVLATASAAPCTEDPVASRLPGPPRPLDQALDLAVRIQVTRSAKAGAARSAADPDSEAEPKKGAGVEREFLVGTRLDDRSIATFGDALEGAVQVVVETGDGTLRLAKYAGRCPQSGVGLVLVDPLPALASTTSPPDAPLPCVGDELFFVGDPLRLGLALSPARVAATGRSITIPAADGMWIRPDLIQLAASVSPGDRGAPLVDHEGRLAGVVLSPARDEHGAPSPAIAHALPIADVREIGAFLEEIRRDADAPNGSHRRPWLGVWAMDIVDPALEAHLALDAEQGILIDGVFDGSPAAAVGLRRYDVVTAIDGKKLRGTLHLHEFLVRAGPGGKLRFEVIRAGKRFEVEVTLAAGD